MIALRVVIGLILAAIVAVALVPMLVLLDLAGGGDGWGLCHGSLASCRAAYFEGPELLAVLCVVLFVLLLLLRLAWLLHRRLQAKQRSVASVGRGDRFGGR